MKLDVIKDRSILNKRHLIVAYLVSNFNHFILSIFFVCFRVGFY